LQKFAQKITPNNTQDIDVNVVSDWNPKPRLCSLMNLNYEINGYCDVRPLNICILHNLITNPFSHELGVVILFIFSAFNLVVLKVWQFFSFFQQFLRVWNLYIKFSNFLGH
jgi:hypothetical protein